MSPALFILFRSSNWVMPCEVGLAMKTVYRDYGGCISYRADPKTEDINGYRFRLACILFIQLFFVI